jgi:pSer/pThr/pTyr-binding forkhead associated (FHA) protein
MKIPEIKIQLVHIDGPFKGEITEFFSPVITLGRHSDCDVVFPVDSLTISRRHAEIRREGNRFLLRDTSSNGTFVNGKQNAEVFLKNGDVLILGVGGPKISFLSTILESGVDTAFQGSPTPPMPDSVAPPPPNPAPPLSRSAPVPSSEPAKIHGRPEALSVRQDAGMKVQKPLVIQYGAVLKAFKSLPVTLGKGADCDFILNAPSILEHHVQIFFDQGQYWVKDLTGRNLLTLNLLTVQTQAPLLPDTYVFLSPEGPKFQFLGEGRLVEVEMAVPGQPVPQTPVQPGSKPPHQEPVKDGKSFKDAPSSPSEKKGVRGLFKNLFGKD